MIRSKSLPTVQVTPSAVVMGGGLWSNVAPGAAPPGTGQFCLNFEVATSGAWAKSGNLERFDGRPRPSDAVYVMLQPETTFSGLAIGDIVAGSASGASATVCYVDADFIAVTKRTGTFTPGEVLTKGGSSVGQISPVQNYPITVGLNANLVNSAASLYRADIAAVPGSGPVRGVAVLNDQVYAWRDNAGATAMVMHRATAGGWTAVALGEYVNFSNANTSVGDGDTLTQGAVSATIARVVVETGTLQSGTNTGKLIITGRAGGNFSGAAATSTGGGSLTLAGAQVAIALLPGGRVETEVYGFTGAAGAKRLYGCDGVNPEFEFDGLLYVPLNTGVTSVRARYVRCHKMHLFYAFAGSLQHSGIGNPYTWSPIFGASELGTGDTITGLSSVSGSETSAAMLVLCQNAAWMLYGKNAGTGNDGWNLVQVADKSGAKDRSVVGMDNVVSFDAGGALAWKPTDSFGNFEWESSSIQVKPLIEDANPQASVMVRQLGRARWFMSDGTVISATPGRKGLQWAKGNIGRSVTCTINDEVLGISRTFYGCDDGFVYEADRGTTNDGLDIECMLKLSALNQKTPTLRKQYRWLEVECSSETPFEMQVSAEFSDQDPNIEPAPGGVISQLGAGSAWDVTSWDASYWDARKNARTRMSTPGAGYNIAPIFYQRGAVGLPHEINVVMVGYTPRRSTNYEGG
jgi:hypothetical protein